MTSPAQSKENAQTPLEALLKIDRNTQTSLLIITIGILIMYIPTLWDLMHGIWASDQQGHGPIVLGIAIWLLWRKLPEIVETHGSSKPKLGWSLFITALIFYVIGHSQGILIFEIGSFIILVIALLIFYAGLQPVHIASFSIFFMIFMVPLPGDFVDAVTQPMKMAVSFGAEQVLFGAGYPISRSGVILQIGQYQLLVADACAGLHTLFTLEALGLLYLNIVRHQSLARNITLAAMIVPISFSANVIRVVTLSLITYYLGDEAGQGFLHGFAGMVLFMVALFLIIATDSLIRFFIYKNPFISKYPSEMLSTKGSQ
jgi:exosortase B